jgi:hypothetical protein
MKSEQKEVFNPVLITLETEEEFDGLRSLLLEIKKAGIENTIAEHLSQCLQDIQDERDEVWS